MTRGSGPWRPPARTGPGPDAGGVRLVEQVHLLRATALLPPAVMLGGIGVHRLAHATMPLRIGLLVSFQPERADAEAALARLLADGGQHLASLDLQGLGSGSVDAEQGDGGHTNKSGTWLRCRHCITGCSGLELAGKRSSLA